MYVPVKKTKFKVKIKFSLDGEIACCSQLCSEDCPNFKTCEEYEMSVEKIVNREHG